MASLEERQPSPRRSQRCEYRLRVGDVILGLECPTESSAESMAHYFDLESAAGTPDVRLRLNILPHEDRPFVPDSFYSTKRCRAGGFVVGDGLVRGEFNPENREGELWIKHILTRPPVTRVLEQLFYQAFYSGLKQKDKNSILVHAAGVLRGDDGFLFVGEPGAGKSTIAELSQHLLVVNDEMCLVELREPYVTLQGTPFNGLFRGKTTGKVRLRAVLLLAQGPVHRLKTIRPSEALPLIATQIVPPIGLEAEVTPAVKQTMLNLAADLIARVAVRRLTFARDPAFWHVIAENFPKERTNGGDN